MELSERKKKILKAVVCENIKNAQPVSSQDLKERYINDLSSATIRNELMALEEMGFLSQPHSSSGRIPTPEAFRLYVSDLANKVKPTSVEVEKIRRVFDDKMVDMEDFARNTAKIISDATHYASAVKMNVGGDAIIQTIKVVKISKTQALVVVVTDVGIIKDIIINTLKSKEEEFFNVASKFITSIFAGKSIDELTDAGLIAEKVEQYRDLFNMVLEVVVNRENTSAENFAVEGASNLFEYPEYTMPDKAKQTLMLFENKEELYPLIKNSGNFEISIKVGGDKDSKLSNCSMVTATYKVNGKNIGDACVIGPVRMDYEKAIKVLKGVSESLSDCFNKEDTDE